VRCKVLVQTVSSLLPMFFVIRSGNARAYSCPRSERAASPPILPHTLNMLSPCYKGTISDEVSGWPNVHRLERRKCSAV